MKILVTAPVNLISNKLSSHKSAEGWIYYDMTKVFFEKEGHTVDIETTQDKKDYSEYDVLMLYHGNDFSGALNLFGGLENVAVAEQLARISKFYREKRDVISFKIAMPNYSELVAKRLSGKTGYPKIWDEIDLFSLEAMSEDTKVFKPEENINSKKLVIGDSHAICMYRNSWAVNSVPFQTLNGALRRGLDTFIPKETSHYDELEFYFGNIDIRHHLFRLGENIDDACSLTRSLAQNYVQEVSKLGPKTSIYIPLPIENESRVVPKSGWHKGKPFWGSWDQRNLLRDVFIYTLDKEAEHYDNVEIKHWCDYLVNTQGELDFQFMEKPRSVHLSREFYPYWTGEQKVVSESTGLF